jgi:nucleotide-binding universal stress UspA family protein
MVQALVPGAGHEENVAIAAENVLAGVKETAQRLDQPCDTLHVNQRFPAEGIMECASEKCCDIIVLASHGRRGVRRLTLGSAANEVVTRNIVPVLICRC